ncbi:MAG: hypothetical protein J6M66_02135 [Lachnospiraceae bacterium]|nr:hypothetical protein [Lachnospiraceae bacterium]
MAQPEAIKAYYATLSRREKIRFLIGLTMHSGQVTLADEVEECRKELIRDFFSPKDENGKPDMAELDRRLSGYVYETARQTMQLGKVIEVEEKKLPATITGEQRKIAAAARAERLSLENHILLRMQRFLQDDVIRQGLLPEETVAAVLRSAGKNAETQTEKRDAFLEVINNAEKTLAGRLKKPQYASMQKYYELGKTTASGDNALHPDLKDDPVSFTDEEKQRADRRREEYAVITLGKELETAGIRGSVKLADDAAGLPRIMKQGLARLSAGGENKTWWHRKNSEAFSQMMTTLGNYEDALRSGNASEDYLNTAKQTLIETGLRYVKGKEKVRSSEFGKARFEAAMTLLASVMDREEFQSLIERINIKRGLTQKVNDPDHVTARQYLRKASVMTRSVPMNEETGMCIDTLEEYYGPISSKKGLDDIDISNLQGVSGKALTSKEFAAAAYAAAMSPEAAMKGKPLPHMNPADNAIATRANFTTDLAEGKDIGEYLGAVQYSREKAQEAFEAYRNGDRAPLGKILGEALHEMAAQTRCAERVEDKWVYEAEQKAQMLQMLTKDKDLMQAAKTAGLTDEDLTITNAAIEIGRIRGRAQLAKEQLKTETEITKEQKLALYTDLSLDIYINEQVQWNYYDTQRNDEAYDAIRKAEVQVGGQIYKDVFEINARRKYTEIAPDVKALGEKNGVNAYRQAIKNVIRREGIDLLSPEKADRKFNNMDFQKQTLAKEIDKVRNTAPKASKSAGLG